MKKLLLTTSMIAVAGSAMAVGLDRSGQNVGVLFEEGRVFQLSLSSVMPDVSGTAFGGETDNMANDYMSYSLGYKADINSSLSYALIFDQPYGADIEYTSSPLAGTFALYESQAITALMRYKFNENFSVYGGVRVETIEASLAKPTSGYAITSESNTGYGYVVGAAYEKPEIALRVALTYSSEISHDGIGVSEDAVHPVFGPFTSSGEMDVTSPQSVNLDFQTGINPTTLVFGSVRWTDWKNFSLDSPIGGTLLDYDDNKLAYSIGVGKKLSENFSVLASVGYEAADKDNSDFSYLSPSTGKKSVTLGGIYTINNTKITAGVNYTRLGDVANGNNPLTPLDDTDFSDNSAVGFGLKISQSF